MVRHLGMKERHSDARNTTAIFVEQDTELGKELLRDIDDWKKDAQENFPRLGTLGVRHALFTERVCDYLVIFVEQVAFLKDDTYDARQDMTDEQYRRMRVWVEYYT